MPEPEVPRIISGFKVASVHCGLKATGELDFVLIVGDVPSSAAGVFTSNRFKSASVQMAAERLDKHAHHIRVIAINTGCANAFTGLEGIENALQIARWVAERLNCDENEVLVLSTGVVGSRLPMERIQHGIDLAFSSLGDDWEAAARAIRTTDKTPKIWWRYIYGVHILGIASARLCVLVSDAAITPNNLQDTLSSVVDGSYALSTVDGEDSPDQAIVMLTSGASGIKIEGGYHENWGVFGLDVRLVCDELAWFSVRDENGATKIIQIRVTGAPDNWWNEVKWWSAAHQIAYTIATSLRVKKGFYNNTVNWGDIVAAAGRSGVPLELEKMSLWIMPDYLAMWPENALALMLYGTPTNYDSGQAKTIVSLPRFNIILHCGMGGYGEATFTTCDLSREYISLNGNSS